MAWRSQGFDYPPVHHRRRRSHGSQPRDTRSTQGLSACTKRAGPQPTSTPYSYHRLAGRALDSKSGRLGSTPSGDATLAHSSTGRATVSEAEGSWFKSRCANHARSSNGRTEAFEALGGGSTPSRATTSSPCSSAWIRASGLGPEGSEVQILSRRPLTSTAGRTVSCNLTTNLQGSTPWLVSIHVCVAQLA